MFLSDNHFLIVNSIKFSWKNLVIVFIYVHMKLFRLKAQTIVRHTKERIVACIHYYITVIPSLFLVFICRYLLLLLIPYSHTIYHFSWKHLENKQFVGKSIVEIILFPSTISSSSTFVFYPLLFLTVYTKLDESEWCIRFIFSLFGRMFFIIIIIIIIIFYSCSVIAFVDFRFVCFTVYIRNFN